MRPLSGHGFISPLKRHVYGIYGKSHVVPTHVGCQGYLIPVVDILIELEVCVIEVIIGDHLQCFEVLARCHLFSRVEDDIDVRPPA